MRILKLPTTSILALATVLMSLLLPLLPLSTAMAISDPASAPSVNRVDVYEDLLEAGDVGILIDYYLDYSVLPTETATESFMAVFVDTDGTTQIRSVAPYTFVTSGYGRGVIWIYFSAAEATTYSLDSADSALYRVWLMGNPTLTWTPSGIPTKTIALIDDWHTTGDPNVLLAQRVLTYADILELAWTLDMIQVTSLGNKLTSTGESYFENVIASLRTMAPAAFSSGTTSPVYSPINYDTTFGATVTSGTATVVGSPITLQVYDSATSNTTVVNTGATTGTIVVDLANWTSGTVTNLTGVVTGSPVTIGPGVNTLTVTGAGTFTVYAAVTDQSTLAETAVTGTGLDLTTAAAAFGMSRWMFSGLIWILITVIICASAYKVGAGDSYNADDTSGGTKVIMLVFTVCVIGGSLLGLLHPLVVSLLTILSGAFVGYILFFRSESLHKGFMFMVWMFVVTSLAGNMAAGNNSLVSTALTTNVAQGTINSISVRSTTGFPSSGIIVIGDEEIGYPSKTSTTFTRMSVLGVTTNPILRGANNTDDVAHLSGAIVRMKDAGILNASIDYKIANIVDSAGVVGFVTLPAKLLDLLMTFFILPLSFLGTDLAILTYIWAVIAIGMLVGLVTAIVGGRRV